MRKGKGGTEMVKGEDCPQYGGLDPPMFMDVGRHLTCFSRSRDRFAPNNRSKHKNNSNTKTFLSARFDNNVFNFSVMISYWIYSGS